ncbi:MAG: prolyl oligopeptidase family serine peptidase, partial [Chitinophagales bacterium]
MKRKSILTNLIWCFTFFLFASGVLFAQADEGYQKPSSEILDLVDVPLAPYVLVDNSKSNMILLYRDAYKTIAELCEEEMRLGGLRINPVTNIGSRTTYYKNLKVKQLTNKKAVVQQATGLPENPRLSNFVWSPDQSKIAMTNTVSTGVEVWVLDIAKGKTTKLADAGVNANLRGAMKWFKDGKSLLVKMVSSERQDLINADAAIPTGPTISVNEGGTKAQNRTYQDLLKNKVDEHNFEQLAISELYKVTLDGKKILWMKSGMYQNMNFSPDGEYVMISTIGKPFSYLVPYYRFPSKTKVYTKDAKLVETLVEVPLIEDLPKGFMSRRTGKRNFSWRDDKPASVIYVEALDGGDPAKEVDYRDEVFQLDAPFKGAGKSILKTKNRYRYIIWGDDNTAIAYDYWWNDRNTKTYVFNPSDAGAEAQIIADRSYQDRYSDPGDFVEKRNEFGRYVLATKDGNAFLMGDGFSKEGQFPFVDKMNLESKKTERLYQSKYTDKLENFSRYDVDKNELMVRIESKSDYPNYYFRDLGTDKLNQITSFENPFKSLQNVEKEVISYKRADGLELSGTLYLPVGYDKAKKEKMPMILWAYPREFKDKSSASQNTQNPNEFTYPYWGSPIYWVAKGYVVLDDAAFPIIGEGEEQPNDSFRSQLVANAKAAIDAVDELGYIDRNKVAVGGHSYGAFMVANLLSHSDLFAAGIARSGAYNRTLTPFGFQSEERNYWEAPEVYYTMSPFMHAEKMKTPLLLVHGEADN